MSDFKAKMHQVRFPLWLRPIPRWGSLQRSPRPLAVFKGPIFKETAGGSGTGEGKGLGKTRGRGGEGRGELLPVGESGSASDPNSCLFAGHFSVRTFFSSSHLMISWC